MSVEFDDYKTATTTSAAASSSSSEGERYNVDNPQLLWDLGWFIGQKIGRADEHVQYRRLFKETTISTRPTARSSERDNWLVGKEWYLTRSTRWITRDSASAARARAISIPARPNRKMNYAEAIEEEGYFDKARRAWIKAGRRVASIRQHGHRALDRRQDCSWARSRSWKKKSPT